MTTPVSKSSFVGKSQSSKESNGEITELQYVLATVLSETSDSPLAKSLENHGLTTIANVLLLNQAERNALSFPEVDSTLNTLPVGHKNKLLAIKLFGQHYEEMGNTITDWKQVTRDEFNSFRCSTDFDNVAEKLTVHPNFKVDSDFVQGEAFKNAAVANDVKHSVYTRFANGYYQHHIKPARQLEPLHYLLHMIDQGNFGVSYGVKDDPLPHDLRNYSHWPLDKSASLPRTLVQLACQDFKKEPPDNHALLPGFQFATISEIFHFFGE